MQSIDSYAGHVQIQRVGRGYLGRLTAAQVLLSLRRLLYQGGRSFAGEVHMVSVFQWPHCSSLNIEVYNPRRARLHKVHISEVEASRCLRAMGEGVSWREDDDVDAPFTTAAVQAIVQGTILLQHVVGARRRLRLSVAGSNSSDALLGFRQIAFDETSLLVTFWKLTSGEMGIQAFSSDVSHVSLPPILLLDDALLGAMVGDEPPAGMAAMAWPPSVVDMEREKGLDFLTSRLLVKRHRDSTRLRVCDGSGQVVRPSKAAAALYARQADAAKDRRTGDATGVDTPAPAHSSDGDQAAALAATSVPGVPVSSLSKLDGDQTAKELLEREVAATQIQRMARGGAGRAYASEVASTLRHHLVTKSLTLDDAE